MGKLFVEQRRGRGSASVAEAVHEVDALLCDVDGNVQLLSGTDCVTTLRSAGKPFQLEVSLSLLPEPLRKQLSSQELALGAASHHGERFHVAALTQLLSHLGVSERDLLCGAHAPTHVASAHALYARGEQPSAIHNNCAGKHAFMAAACRAHGLAMDYRPAAHALQRAFLARIGEWGGQTRPTVVDGCGVPCPVLPLSAMARAYATLACELRDGSGSTLATIGRAMRAHPLLVSGSEAFDGWVMQHTSVLAKVGALGLLCIAIPQRGLGLALKVRSGSELARPAAAALLLERVLPGCLGQELPSRFRIVRNVAGVEVGEIVTRLEAD
jgi:L-asparaginase II